MDKDYLMAPGPTPVPPQVLEQMARPIFHHRTPKFESVVKEATQGLQYVFQTANPVITLTSSGTGAMEAALVNTVGEGTKVLVVQGGKFGERFAEIAAAYRFQYTTIDVPWGRAVDPAEIEAALNGDPAIGLVCTTCCETSTGVVTDIEALGKVVAATDALLVVDGISSVGAMKMLTDQWGVDLLVVGSQKALMLPPGLAFLAVSEKAWKRIEANPFHGYYFDLLQARQSLDKLTTPYTPALGLVLALAKSLEIMRERGIENIWAETARLARAARAGVGAMGLELFADPPADALTAVSVPEDVDGARLVKTLRDKYHVTIAGGQAQLKGKIFRIAHMGYIGSLDLLVTLAAVEVALKELGYDVEPGTAVAAAERELYA